MTERARTAMRAAVEAARLLGHRYVGTEHILFVLYEPARGRAAHILDTASHTPVSKSTSCARTPRHGHRSGRDAAVYAPSGRVDRTRGRGGARPWHNNVGTEHLLLALFADTDAVASTILAEAGANSDQFRARVIEMLAGPTMPER